MIETGCSCQADHKAIYRDVGRIWQNKQHDLPWRFGIFVPFPYDITDVFLGTIIFGILSAPQVVTVCDRIKDGVNRQQDTAIIRKITDPGHLI